MSKAAARKERPESAARACLTSLPYRMVCFLKEDGNGVPIYRVAGSASTGMGAEKALREAHRLYGGACFYCRKEPMAAEFTIDHADPVSSGGTGAIQNLLITCRTCNQSKGRKPIEFFNPEGGREWLEAVLAQVQDRLNRL